MASTVRVQMQPTQKILLKRALNANGKGQQYFTKQLEKYMNNYVPYDTGNLKDMSGTIKTKQIIYNAPYSEKQYYTNRGMGKGGLHNGGLRGRYWDKRCWQQRGNEIVQSVAKYCGVRGKKK